MYKCAFVLALALAAAPALAKDKPTALVFHDDTQTGISFQYPRGWRNIVIADDSSKAEATTDDRQSRLTIESVMKPAEGGVTGVIEKKVPGGAVGGGSGDWKCIEGDIESGKRHAAFCGRRMGKTSSDLLIIGITTASAKAFQKLGGKALLLQIAASTKGFKATAEE